MNAITGYLPARAREVLKHEARAVNLLLLSLDHGLLAAIMFGDNVFQSEWWTA